MNVEKTKKAAEIMLAWAEGKTIQCRECEKSSWYTIPKPEDDLSEIAEWDFSHFEYRIKPHYRPFKSAEEVMEAIKEKGSWLHGTNTDCIGYFKIQAVTHNGIDTNAVSPSFHFAYDMFTFLDGTPFGKLEE